MVFIRSPTLTVASNSSLISLTTACCGVSPASIFPPGNSQPPLNSPYPLAVKNIFDFRIPFKNQVVFENICIVRFSLCVVLAFLCFFLVIYDKNKYIFSNSVHFAHCKWQVFFTLRQKIHISSGIFFI